MRRLWWLLLSIPLLLASGLVYQRRGSRRDRRRLIKRGSVIDLSEGVQLYLSQRGSSGPSVVFESGIAASSQNWVGTQEIVSQFARAYTYDRAGLGWSSAAISERTPSNIVRELRQLLRVAAVPAPYLLVGHSFGGLVVRRYAVDFPDEIVGVLLVDAMRTDDWPPVNDERMGTFENGKRLARVALPFALFGLIRLATMSVYQRSGRTSRALSKFTGAGGRHLVERVVGEVSKMPREVWPVVAAQWSGPGFYRGLLAHLCAVPATVREMHAVEPVNGVPVCLLTPTSAQPLSEEQLRRIGPATTQIIVENSGHWIHLDQPQVVVSAIQSMVEKMR